MTVRPQSQMTVRHTLSQMTVRQTLSQMTVRHTETKAFTSPGEKKEMNTRETKRTQDGELKLGQPNSRQAPTVQEKQTNAKVNKQLPKTIVSLTSKEIHLLRFNQNRKSLLSVGWASSDCVVCKCHLGSVPYAVAVDCGVV